MKQGETANYQVVHVNFSTPHRARVSYSIEIGVNILEKAGEMARRVLSPHARRIAVISNARVFGFYGANLVESLRAARFEVAHWLMGDGERFKTLRTAQRALEFLGRARIERSDAVIALGGGVVGDLAGFAAATFLRGVDFIQIPTTLLAQIDSSVGGKTGVNSTFGKNTIGAFHQPRAVLIDVKTLETLPPRELTAGWCEAIKQGAVGDRKLFDATRDFLRKVPSPKSQVPSGGEKSSVRSREAGEAKRKSEIEDRSSAALGFATWDLGLSANPQSAMSRTQSAVLRLETWDLGLKTNLVELIAAQCAFKARIVAGDEREDFTRGDVQSRRILNFGHTVAHALERITAYRRFRHGEAVGYGMLAAAEISKKLHILSDFELQSLRETVRLAGRLPRADDLDVESILLALASDKKSVGGNVQWVLLEKLGRARIVDGREIAPRIIRASIASALQSN
jgi:3-dehydroquinate synthase